MAANPSSVKTPFVRPTVDELGFDPAALRAKYLDERNKRLRTEGNAQYREVTGDLQRFTDDPYIEAPIVREPVTEEIDVAIVGGGFGGLLAAVRLEVPLIPPTFYAAGLNYV